MQGYSHKEDLFLGIHISSAMSLGHEGSRFLSKPYIIWLELPSTEKEAVDKKPSPESSRSFFCIVLSLSYRSFDMGITGSRSMNLRASSHRPSKLRISDHS